MERHATHTKSIELIDKARENHVILMCIPPHTSHNLQPLDVSFMAPLSCVYSEKSRKWILEHPGRVITVAQAGNSTAFSEKGDTSRKKHENIGEASENAATPDPSGSKVRVDKTSKQSPQTPVQGKTPVGLFSILLKDILPVPDKEIEDPKCKSLDSEDDDPIYDESGGSQDEGSDDDSEITDELEEEDFVIFRFQAKSTFIHYIGKIRKTENDDLEKHKIGNLEVAVTMGLTHHRW
ncbi:hypothetical protein ILUMI_18226 [Ignelater luminosus]|uniref:DDE-1 domain-containing protein n=1 Tax=Ignelater luminosus TaxID=2038154 RepID=A0A8K0CPJ3_IGNLU|nr:hypothetical protein ILUMI_18226 [Ignelater luminosus]